MHPGISSIDEVKQTSRNIIRNDQVDILMSAGYRSLVGTLQVSNSLSAMEILNVECAICVPQ